MAKSAAQRWAEYVKHNPTNARKVVLADRAKKNELAKIQAYYKQNGHTPTLLSRESHTRFGAAGTQQSNDLARQVATGKLTMAQAQKMVREGALVKHDPTVLRAGLDVSAELDPQINAATRRRKLLKDQTDRSIQQDESKTTAYTGRVRELYDALMAKMASQTPQIQQNYDTASQGIASNTNNLQAQIAAAYARANQSTSAAAQGMGAGTTVAQQEGGQDAAFLSGLAGVQGQGIQGILAAGKQGAENSQRASINYAGYEGTNEQTNALRELLARTNESRQAFNDEDYELGGQIGDLEESRYAKLYETKQSLQEAAAQAEAEQEDRIFQRQLAQAKLNIDAGELDVKRAGVSIDQQKVNNDIARLGLDRAKIELDARKSEAQIRLEQQKLSPGSITYMEKEAAINLKRAQSAAALTNARTAQRNAATRAADVARKVAQPVRAGAYGKGIGGVQNYMKDIGADKRTSDFVLKHIQNMMVRHKTYQEGIKEGERFLRNNKVPKDVANAYRRAAGIAYGRST